MPLSGLRPTVIFNSESHLAAVSHITKAKKQKRNTIETERDSRAAEKAGYKTVKITIRAEFSEAKLIIFDVSKSMQ